MAKPKRFRSTTRIVRWQTIPLAAHQITPGRPQGAYRALKEQTPTCRPAQRVGLLTLGLRLRVYGLLLAQIIRRRRLRWLLRSLVRCVVLASREGCIQLLRALRR